MGKGISSYLKDILERSDLSGSMTTYDDFGTRRSLGTAMKMVNFQVLVSAGQITNLRVIGDIGDKVCFTFKGERHLYLTLDEAMRIVADNVLSS